MAAVASANGSTRVEDSQTSDVQLYVGNLPTSIDTTQLTDEFAKYGEIVDAFVSIRNGRHRGFGFVTFKNAANAASALNAANGKSLADGHKGMRVVFARKRPEGKNNSKASKTKKAPSSSSGGSGKRQEDKLHKPEQKVSANVDGDNKKNTPAATTVPAQRGPSPFVVETTNLVKTRGLSGYEKLKQAFESRYTWLSAKLTDGLSPNPLQLKAFIQDVIVGVTVIIDDGKAPKKIRDHLVETFRQINFDFEKNGPLPGTQPPDFRHVVQWFQKMVAHYDYQESERIERDEQGKLAQIRASQAQA